MSHSIGKFVWFELVSHDIARAKVFYSELFGWKLGEMPMDFGPYTLFDAGQGPVAGAMAADGGSSRWETYVSVDDVDAVAARVVAHGGRREGSPVDVPGVGRMAAVVDPTGARLSLYSSADGDQPDAPTRPGEFVWNELVTDDPVRAVKFYRDVLGYGVQARDMGPRGTYHVLTQGEAMRAGVMAKPMPEAPTAWLPYVHVAKVDELAARATTLGAQVVSPPTDIAGVGRFAVLVDPTGAAIAVLTPLPRG